MPPGPPREPRQRPEIARSRPDREDVSPHAPSSSVRDGILVAAIVAIGALYIASIGPYWNISPDSTTYVGWAKALLAGVPYARGPVQPPVTSLVYAAVLFFFPNGYTALNAATMVLILIWLALVYVWVARRTGRTEGLLVVLLCLASTRLYHESTQLLSEPSYMVLSMAVLVLLDRPVARTDGPATFAVEHFESRRLATLFAGTLIVAAVLTRTIGIALVLAVLAIEGWKVVRRERPVRWSLIGFAAASFAAVALWELFGTRQPYIVNWFRMFLRRDVWSTGSPGLSLPELFGRLRDHAGGALGIGRMLANSWAPSSAALGVLLPAGLLLILLAGLLHALRRRVTVAGLYVALYLGVIIAHMLVGGDSSPRFLVPVLPFLFYYGLEGARALVTYTARRLPAAGSTRSLATLATLYAMCFVAVGIRPLRAGVRAVHASPFGTYPIKRPSNYDAQRLAMWIRDHAGLDDVFASWQRDMFEVLAERRGRALTRGLLTPADSFVDWLDTQHIRYLLVDHQSGDVADSLMSAIRGHPASFRLVSALHDASLYEVLSGPR